MTRILFILLFLLIFIPTTVVADHYEISVKCVGCHKIMSETGNPNIPPDILVSDWSIKSKPNCQKCHEYLAKGKGASNSPKLQKLHLDICSGCHPEMHTLHVEKRIGCRVCHQSPRGWNSSIVSIPAMPEIPKDGMYIPESGDCGSCHINARTGDRVHDFHARNIEELCTSCHGEGIQAPLGEEEGEEGRSFVVIRSILGEFSTMFDGISKDITTIISGIRPG